MSTAIAEKEKEIDSFVKVDPELRKKANNILLKECGISANTAANLLFQYITVNEKLPSDLLDEIPINVICGMTEEEFNAAIQRGFDDLEAGRFYSIDEAERILEEELNEIISR